MKWEQLVKLGLGLPEVEEAIWYRTPALKVRGKAFVRLKEDGQSVVFLLESVDEQEFLTRAQPELYFITPHYIGYPAVLARLARLRVAECRRRLEQGWRLKAPKVLVKQRDAAGESPAPSGTRRPTRSRGAGSPSRTGTSTTSASPARS